jgi:hypothetical protein
MYARLLLHVFFCILYCISAEKQACLLTKSQPFYDLPESVTDLNNVPELPDQVSYSSVVQSHRFTLKLFNWGLG